MARAGGPSRPNGSGTPARHDRPGRSSPGVLRGAAFGDAAEGAGGRAGAARLGGDQRPVRVTVPLVFHDGLHQHLRLFLPAARVRAADPSGVMEAASRLSELPVPPGALAQIDQSGPNARRRALPAAGRMPMRWPRSSVPREVWFQYAVGSPFFAGTYQRLLRARVVGGRGPNRRGAGMVPDVAERSPYELLFLARAERRQAELLARGARRPRAMARWARMISPNAWSSADRAAGRVASAHPFGRHRDRGRTGRHRRTRGR